MNKINILDFCKIKHKNQKRRGGAPYIDHLIETAKITTYIAKELSNKYTFLKNEIDDLYVTGLLHDTIEDTNTDYEDILELTNEKIALWVKNLSNDKRLPSEIRRHLYYNDIKNSCIEIKIVKLADIFSNLEGINGKEGNLWILMFLEKAKTTLNTLEPELIETQYYNKCKTQIVKWEKRLKNNSNPMPSR
jgi:(p)ppGpp synthase/HD superfamily hydrolase